MKNFLFHWRIQVSKTTKASTFFQLKWTFHQVTSAITFRLYRIFALWIWYNPSPNSYTLPFLLKHSETIIHWNAFKMDIVRTKSHQVTITKQSKPWGKLSGRSEVEGKEIIKYHRIAILGRNPSSSLSFCTEPQSSFFFQLSFFFVDVAIALFSFLTPLHQPLLSILRRRSFHCLKFWKSVENKIVFLKCCTVLSAFSIFFFLKTTAWQA